MAAFFSLVDPYKKQVGGAHVPSIRHQGKCLFETLVMFYAFHQSNSMTEIRESRICFEQVSKLLILQIVTLTNTEKHNLL